MVVHVQVTIRWITFAIVHIQHMFAMFSLTTYRMALVTVILNLIAYYELKIFVLVQILATMQFVEIVTCCARGHLLDFNVIVQMIVR